MTKKESLEKCIEMWEWLAEHPKADKMDYFDNNPVDDVPVYECYCCEYVFTNFVPSPEGNDLDCTKCPIHWGTEGDRACTNLGSPYKEWATWGCLITEKSKHAKAVAELAKKALKDLD